MPNIPGPFTLTDVTLRNAPEASLKLRDVAGFAELLYGPNATLVAGGATGLANDGTAYTANVTVDGVVRAVSVVGSAAQTFTTLLSEINVDLGSAFAVATLSANRIVITSRSTGSASSVVVADTGTFPLFASVKSRQFGLAANQSTVGYSAYVRWSRMWEEERAGVLAGVALYNTSAVEWTQGIDFINSAGTGIVPGAPTGLALTTTYEIRVAINGGSNITVPVVGRVAQTYQQLVAALSNASVIAGSTATVSWTQFNSTNGRIVFTSPTYGTSSTIALTAGASNDLITALTNGPFTATNGAAVAGVNGTAGTLITNGVTNIDFGAAVAGGDATGLRNDATAYTMDVVVGTRIIPVSVVGSTAQTFTNLATEIQTDLAAALTGTTCAVSGGDLVITAPTLTPGTQSVNVGGAQTLASATSLVGGTTYTASIVVDGGTSQSISILGSTAQTYGTLINELNADTFGASWSLVAGNLLCTSDTSGATSSIAITAGTLFAAPLAGFVSVVAATAGTGLAAAAGFIRIVDRDLLTSLRLFAVPRVVRASVANYEDVFRFFPTNPAEALWNTVGSKAHLEVPAKPYALGDAVRSGMYFNATSTNWTSFLNNTAVSPTVNPPEA